VLAVALWVLITVAPAFLPHEPGSMLKLIDAVSGGIAVNTLLAIVVLAGIALALRWNDLGFNRPRPWRSLWLLWVPGLYLLLFYVTDAVIGFPPLPTLGILFVNTLLVGISEELAFRGVLLRGLRTRLGMCHRC
jgi:membrane protease YdiL (CAAX protease family)